MGHLGSTWSSSAPGEHPRRFAWHSTGTDRSIQIVPPSWDCAPGRRQPGKTPAVQTGMSVEWDAFLSTAVHPHSGSFMCVQSQRKEWLQTRATSRISFQHCLPQEFLRWENFSHCHGTEGPTKFHYPQVFATNCVRTTDCHNLLPTSSHHLYPPTLQGSSRACWKIFNPISLEGKWEIFQQMIMGFNGVAGDFYHISDKTLQKRCCNFFQHH